MAYPPDPRASGVSDGLRADPQEGTHEDAYMGDRGGVMSSAIGLARLALLDGNPAKAAEILHECCDELHRLHWDACLADGHEPRKIELLLGPRDEKVLRAWRPGAGGES